MLVNYSWVWGLPWRTVTCSASLLWRKLLSLSQLYCTAFLVEVPLCGGLCKHLNHRVLVQERQEGRLTLWTVFVQTFGV